MEHETHIFACLSWLGEGAPCPCGELRVLFVALHLAPVMPRTKTCAFGGPFCYGAMSILASPCTRDIHAHADLPTVGVFASVTVEGTLAPTLQEPSFQEQSSHFLSGCPSALFRRKIPWNVQGKSHIAPKDFPWLRPNGEAYEKGSNFQHG